jgi:hypothetical protein
MCGGIPFINNFEQEVNEDDPFGVYRDLDEKDLEFPPSMKDELAKDLIRKLL